jgi:hypothetical protein
VSEATTADPDAAAAAPSPLTVRLEEFEGPLDLLLHLARTEEIDLARLPIRRITDQYLAYLESVEFRDLDDAGAFLVLAATLVYLKSRLLLPPAESAEEALEEERACARARGASERLCRVKEVGSGRAGGGGSTASREPEPARSGIPADREPFLWDHQRIGLSSDGSQAEPTREVEPEPPPLLERMAMIAGVHEQSWYVLFSTAGATAPTRGGVPLAVLELVRSSGRAAPGAVRHRDRAGLGRRGVTPEGGSGWRRRRWPELWGSWRFRLRRAASGRGLAEVLGDDPAARAVVDAAARRATGARPPCEVGAACAWSARRSTPGACEPPAAR